MRYEISPETLCDDVATPWNVTAYSADIHLRGIPDMSPITWDALSPAADFYIQADLSGMPLSEAFKTILFDEPVPSKFGTSVLSRASLLVGTTINRQQKLSHLFFEGEQESANWRPGQEQFDQLIESTSSPHYKLLARMMRDVAYPRDDPESKYRYVRSRLADDAYTVKAPSCNAPHQTRLCGYFEELFARLFAGYPVTENKGNMRPVESDSFIYGFQEAEVDQLMLSTDPLLLNGVRIESGSLFTVDGSEETGYSLAYGRMSALGCASFYDSVRYFARNLEGSALTYAKDEQYLAKALPRFHELADLPIIEEPNAQTVLPRPESPCTENDMSQLRVQNELYKMATRLQDLRTPGTEQAIARDAIIRRMSDLRRTTIEAYGLQAFENAQLACLGGLAASQSRSSGGSEAS